MNHIKNKYLIGLFCIIVCFCIYLLMTKQKESIVLITPDNKSLSEIKKACPFYEPDGASYTACLFTYLDSKEQELVSILKDIIPAISDIQNIDSAHQYLFRKLAQYNNLWLAHRDAFCDLDTVYTYAGSGQEQYITICRIEKTQEYIEMLTLIENTWIKN